QGAWNEVGTGITLLLDLTGNGVLNYSGSQYGVNSSQLHGTQITNFTGTASLVGLFQPSCGGTCDYGNFSLTGNGSGGNVLGLGLVSANGTFWQDTTSPPDTNKLLNSQRHDTAQVAEIGSVDPTFLTNTLALMRTGQPTVPGALPAGQTNVGLYGINVSNARYGLHLVKN